MFALPQRHSQSRVSFYLLALKIYCINWILVFCHTDDLVTFQAAHYDLLESLPYSKLHKLTMDGIKREIYKVYRDELPVNKSADLQLLNEDCSLVTLKDIIPGATIVVTNGTSWTFNFNQRQLTHTNCMSNPIGCYSTPSPFCILEESAFGHTGHRCWDKCDDSFVDWTGHLQ